MATIQLTPDSNYARVPLLSADGEVNYITWSVRKPGEKLSQAQRSRRYFEMEKYFKLPLIIIKGGSGFGKVCLTKENGKLIAKQDLPS